MKKGLDFTGISVVFLCHDGNGNFLFSQRGQSCRDEQGMWDPGGGSLEFGESIDDAVVREVSEEYGARVLEKKFLGFREALRLQNGHPSHWIAFDFLVLVDPKQVKNNEPHKLDAIGWFRLNNLPTPLHSQIPKYFEKYGSQLC